MGYDVYGTDISPKMIDYSRANLDWLMDNRHLRLDDRKKRIIPQTGDAIDFHLGLLCPPHSAVCPR